MAGKAAWKDVPGAFIFREFARVAGAARTMTGRSTRYGAPIPEVGSRFISYPGDASASDGGVSCVAGWRRVTFSLPNFWTTFPHRVCTLTDRSAQDTWTATLGQLETELPRTTFDTWLRETEGLAFEGMDLLVQVPSVFTIAWLEQRMYQLSLIHI